MVCCGVWCVVRVGNRAAILSSSVFDASVISVSVLSISSIEYAVRTTPQQQQQQHCLSPALLATGRAGGPQYPLSLGSAATVPGSS